MAEALHATHVRAGGWLLLRAIVLALSLAAPAAADIGIFTRIDPDRLVATAASYAGTPYQYGGSSRTGIDCSGFVYAVYFDQGIVLPRRSEDLFHLGEPVDRGSLQVGDLVFFRTYGRSVSHVGIITAPGRFTHASTTRGVITERLDDDYWRPRYLGARRVASRSTYVAVAATTNGPLPRPHIALVDAYPFTVWELLDIPTAMVADDRAFGVALIANGTGDLVVNPQASFFRRLQLGAFLPVAGAIGDGDVSLQRPDAIAKVRIFGPTRRLPAIAIGADMRRDHVVRKTSHGDSTIATARRGLFLATSAVLAEPSGQYVGHTRIHGGVNAAVFEGLRDFRASDDISGFIGVDQALLKRLTLVGEMDNIGGAGGWRANVGGRVSVTDDAVVEYGVHNLGGRGLKIDRVLKLSYAIPW